MRLSVLRDEVLDASLTRQARDAIDGRWLGNPVGNLRLRLRRLLPARGRQRAEGQEGGVDGAREGGGSRSR